MKKLFLLIGATFLVLGNHAQSNGDYDMLIHKNDGSVLKLPVNSVDSVTFSKKETVLDLSFDIQVLGIHDYDADIKITPSDLSATYFYGVIKDDLYQKMINQYGSIPDMDKAWWQYTASLYGMDWLEIMKEQLYTGEIEFNSKSDLSILRWDTIYHVYCYGIDQDGNLTSEFHDKTFRTNKPVPSDNQISVEVLSVENGKVTIKVTTTNDDPYFIDSQKKSYVDYNVESLGSDDEMLFELIKAQGLGNQYIHTGTEEIVLYPKSSDTDYYIIATGFKGGPTTKIQLIPFHTN